MRAEACPSSRWQGDRPSQQNNSTPFGVIAVVAFSFFGMPRGKIDAIDANVVAQAVKMSLIAGAHGEHIKRRCTSAERNNLLASIIDRQQRVNIDENRNAMRQAIRRLRTPGQVGHGRESTSRSFIIAGVKKVSSIFTPFWWNS